MKHPEFKEYSGVGTDVDGDEHTTKVLAHVVNEDTKDHEWHTRDGQVRKYPVGHVVVKTDHPTYVDVHSPESWNNTDYAHDRDHDAESDE